MRDFAIYLQENSEISFLPPICDANRLKEWYHSLNDQTTHVVVILISASSFLFPLLHLLIYGVFLGGIIWGCSYSQSLCKKPLAGYEAVLIYIDALYLTYTGRSDPQQSDWRSLSCLLQSLCPVSSVRENTTKRFTAHRSKETRMIDPLFTFYCLWCGAVGYFSLGNFNSLSLRLNWYCANKWHVCHSPPKQILELDKIFTIEGITIFVSFSKINTKWKFPRGILKYV